MESNAKSITFLPPLKRSKNKFQLANNDPMVIENNLKKEKDFLELSLDKFSMLTKQPKNVEKMKFQSYSASSKSVREKPNPQATPVNFKWDTSEMPKLKVNKLKTGLKNSLAEKPDEKRMRLQFEQKIAIEQKYFEKAIRDLRSQQFLSHSNETLKRVNENNSARNRTISSSNENFKPDRWSSCEWRDINLSNQVIDQFYSYDHRHMRHFRKYRPSFYTFTPNLNYENTLVKTFDFDERNNIENFEVA